MLQAIVQIIICYIYCLRSSRLFENRKTWFKALKIIALVSVGLYLLLLLIAFVRDLKHENTRSIYTSCSTGIYFIIDSLQNLVLVFFCAVGLYLIHKINTYTPTS